MNGSEEGDQLSSTLRKCRRLIISTSQRILVIVFYSIIMPLRFFKIEICRVFIEDLWEITCATRVRMHAVVFYHVYCLYLSSSFLSSSFSIHHFLLIFNPTLPYLPFYSFFSSPLFSTFSSLSSFSLPLFLYFPFFSSPLLCFLSFLRQHPVHWCELSSCCTCWCYSTKPKGKS